jgi:bacterioferritin-associated ferredoxin
MDLDAKVCLCFRVTRRKLLNFMRVERPRVASQLSQCGGAGTGCGWCVPYLQKIFAGAGQVEELDTLSDDDYARGREEYIESGKGTPPPSSDPK